MRSIDRLTRNSIRPEIKRRFKVGENQHIGRPSRKFDIVLLSAEEQKQVKYISEIATYISEKAHPVVPG
jgi:hypothetical protein